MYQLLLNIVNKFSMVTSTKSYVTVIELMLSGMFIGQKASKIALESKEEEESV